MSAVGISRKRYGDSSLKIHWSLTCIGESESVSATFNIDNMVNVRFKATAKILENKMKFTISFSSSKHEMAKDRITIINLSSNELNYSVNGLHTTENWSDWQEMGLIEPFMRESPKTYYTIIYFYIIVYENSTETIASKLYTDTDFTDFNLTTAEGSVPMHKAILAANSDVFRAMLTKEWKETGEGQINMKGVTIQTLEDLKDYMYLRIVPDVGLRPLLLVARLYLIEDLEKYCIRKLAETVSAEGLYSLMEFACDNNIPELSFAVLKLTQDSVVDAAKITKKVAVID